MLCGMSLDVIGIIGIILLIGIFTKNGIMLVAFAPGGECGLGTEEAMPPALSPDSDDDDVHSAWRRPADARHRYRLGNPPASRLG
jgi:hypothetical protein